MARLNFKSQRGALKAVRSPSYSPAAARQATEARLRAEARQAAAERENERPGGGFEQY